MIRRIRAIAKKEMRQIIRDVRTVIIILIFPVFTLVLFGYALNFDVTNIQIGVYDQDMTYLSREYIKALGSTEYFKIKQYVNSEKDVNQLLDDKVVQCVVVIPSDLSSKFYSNENVKIQYLIDGINANNATVIMNYVNAATQDLTNKYTAEVLGRSGIKVYQPINVESRFWFNPELTTTQFLIPGLISAILTTLTVVLTAIAIVREKELNTIEQINVSPVTSLELLLGKILPYTVISTVIAVLILVAGHFMFDVAIKGNLVLLFISTILYLFVLLNMGIFVSTIVETQQVAFQIGIIFSQLPSNLLSGFIFPIESMPKAVQIASNIAPAKFYIITLRAILIRGVGLTAFWDQWLYMLGIGVFFLIFSQLRIKMQRVK